MKDSLISLTTGKSSQFTGCAAFPAAGMAAVEVCATFVTGADSVTGCATFAAGAGSAAGCVPVSVAGAVSAASPSSWVRE